MIGRVKQYFGIEGVKVYLDAPAEVAAWVTQIEGNVRFGSMNAQRVTRIRVRLVERYSRGRGDNKKIDEYELGSIVLEEDFDILPDQESVIPFVLPFKRLRSEVDDLASQNFIFKGLMTAAKMAYAAESEYFLIAEAKVKGTALPPFAKKAITI